MTEQEVMAVAKDVQTIVLACVEHGLHLAEEDAEELWAAHSANCDAGWLGLPNHSRAILTGVMDGLRYCLLFANDSWPKNWGLGSEEC